MYGFYAGKGFLEMGSMKLTPLSPLKITQDFFVLKVIYRNKKTTSVFQRCLVFMLTKDSSEWDQ
jgi:hypothetical protein